MIFRVFLLVLLSSSLPLQADDTQTDQLFIKARDLRLAEHPTWLALLHFNRDKHESEADGEDFFLSPGGKRNPVAELNAAITLLLTPGPGHQEQLCRFPARYKWLSTQLGLPGDQWRSCEKFLQWNQGLNAGGASLVYAAAYLNNPASMFGHTFLRLDRGGAGRSQLLAYILNYSANPTTLNAVFYTVLGLTGGFEGRFSTVPYYLKVQEYSSMESRDLWVYHLNLTQDEVDFMLMHAWELGQTYFNYFYLDENCSYHILSLLEVARPGLKLRDRTGPWVIPMDTLRVVLQQGDLIDSVEYRPSMRKEMNALAASLDPAEEEAAVKLSRLPVDQAETVDLTGFPRERGNLILQAAALRLRYKSGYGLSEQQEQEVGAGERALQIRRSLLRLPAPEVEIPVPAAPHEGHGTAMWGLAAGYGTHGSFEELWFRPTLHDVLAAQQGYEAETQIEMLSTRLRLENRGPRVYLEGFDLINIFSLAPWEGWSRTISWKLRLGLDAPHQYGCRSFDCLRFGIQGGPGLSFPTHILHREVYYTFLDLGIFSGPDLPDHLELSTGLNAGLIMNLTSFWRIQLEGEGGLSFLGTDLKPQKIFAASLNQGFALTRDLELRLHSRAFSRDLHSLPWWEAMLFLGLYF